jgi:DNA adenine methylase
MSNRDAGDNIFEDRWESEKIKYFDVTYTAGRRKKTENGFEAKPAREVLLMTGRGYLAE